MWSTRKELEAALAQAGLGEWSPRLAAAARHTIILEPGPVEEGADVPIGASRLGGMPDLPSDVPWPWRPAFPDSTVFKDHAERPWPLSFVAQIDFAEIHTAGGLEGFPSSGRLLFFCDPVEWPTGTSEGQTCASVMFFPGHADHLGRRDFPVEFSDPGAAHLRPGDFMFRPRRLTPKLMLLPPPWCSRELRALDGVPPPGWRSTYPKRWKEQEIKAYERFWEDLGAEHPNTIGSRFNDIQFSTIHQVGGIAFAYQDPVEADCVKFADDDYLNHPPPEEKAFWERREKDGPPCDWPDYEEWSQAHYAFKDRERAMYLERAGSWQLVLQIDSDDESGMGALSAASTSASGSAILRNAGSTAVGRCCSALSMSASR